MAIRGFDKKDPMAGLNQLMQLMNQMDAMGARKEKRISDKMLALSRQVDNAKTLDSLSNIMPAIDSFNKEVSNLGFNEYSLDNIVSEKKRLYSNSENSFNEAKMYLDKGLGDPDELYDEIMGMSWKEANDELNTLYSLSSNINEGIKSGYNFKGEGKYTTTSLSKAINTRMGQIQNKLDVFSENEGNFLIFNPDGTMDEASKEIYDDLQFKILSGDNKDFDKYFDDVVDGVARNFQIQDKGYNNWLKIYEQSKNFAKLDDMEGISEEDKASYKAIISGNGEDSDGEISPAFAKQMAEVYRTNAEKYNSQHQVLTGRFYNENPVYKNIDLEDSDIPGTIDASNASKVDSNSKKDIKIKKDPEIIVKKEEGQTKIIDTSKISINLNQSANIKKENNKWQIYDDKSKIYIDLPKENIEEISLNGKIQKVPVIRADKTYTTKEGKRTTKKTGKITHIYVNGKWKKASIPEKKTTIKGISRRSGPGLKGIKDLPLLDFPPIATSKIETQKKKEQESIWKAIAEVLSKGTPFK